MKRVLAQSIMYASYMRYSYYVNVKLLRTYRDGTHVTKRLRVNAVNTTNAILQACTMCRDAGEEPIKMTVDWTNKVPVAKKALRKYNKEKFWEEHRQKKIEWGLIDEDGNEL